MARASSSDSEKDLVPGNAVTESQSGRPGERNSLPVESRGKLTLVLAQGFAGLFLLTRGELRGGEGQSSLPGSAVTVALLRRTWLL